MTRLKNDLSFTNCFRNIVFPVGVLAFYSMLYANLSHVFFPDGVTFNFENTLWKLAICFCAFAMLFCILTFREEISWRKIIKKTDRLKFAKSDFILVIFPLTPVIQYVINNQKDLAMIEIICILLVFILFSAIFIFGFPFLFSFAGSQQSIKLIGLAFVFSVTSMPLLSRSFGWYLHGNFFLQIGLYVGVLLFLSLLSNERNPTYLYLFVVILFVINTFSQLEKSKNPKIVRANDNNPFMTFSTMNTMSRKPNVYLLVYDSYVSNETMKSYGIDNSDQEEYLKKSGFTLYPHTYSLGSSTLDSMGKVFDLSLNENGNQRNGVSGAGIVQQIFKSQGYVTYGIFHSDYMFRGCGSSYDVSSPSSSSSSLEYLISAIFIGEFRFDLGFEKQSHESFVDAKRIVFSSVIDNGEKVFIYSHTNLPEHSQNSGQCQFVETQLFEERLEQANLEMTGDIEEILSNDPKAIIIIAGDHGPYLTKNCTYTTTVYDISELNRQDIQDRYGSFLAVRWPSDDYINYDKITTLQDIFPAVFSYMYEDSALLELKLDPQISIPNNNSGISVNDGVIVGGVDDGEPLFMVAP